MRTVGLFAALISCAWASVWELLPPERDWQRILDSFNSTLQIADYVTVYLAPFRELQAVEQNGTVPAGAIKGSVINLIDQSLGMMSKFNLSQDRYNDCKDQVKAQRFFQEITSTFDNSEGLGPVFYPQTIKNFFIQRLNDMIVGTSSYSEFQSRQRRFNSALKSLKSNLKDQKAEYFVCLVPRNLDYQYVHDYLTRLIGKAKDKGIPREEIGKFKWKIHSLGNAANILLPSTICVFVTLLSLVVII